MKKHFKVYADDGEHVYKFDIPAESEKKALEYANGNGEIVAVKPGERTAENPISLLQITRALKAASFGQMEIDLITRALDDCVFIR